MKLSLAVFVFAAKVVSVYGSAAEFPEEDGIVVLTNKTFDSALQQFPKLFVEFCSYQTDTLSLCNNIATYADILCTTLFAFLMFNGCFLLFFFFFFHQFSAWSARMDYLG